MTAGTEPPSADAARHSRSFEGCGGTIEFDSVLGESTEFRICLRLADAKDC